MLSGAKFEVISALHAHLGRLRERMIEDHSSVVHLENQSLLEDLLLQARTSPDTELRFEFEMKEEGWSQATSTDVLSKHCKKASRASKSKPR